MSNRLEQFVRDHREEFDTEEPDSKIWEKIRTDAGPRKKKQGVLVRLGRAGSIAAAAAVLLAVACIWFFNRTVTPPPTLVKQTPKTNPTNSIKAANVPQTSIDSAKTEKEQPTLASIRPRDNQESAAKTTELDNTMDEEMYHYAKLVEIKHNQLKVIEKDEPLLYKQFASDVNRLDSVYHNLQSQLPKNPNREQLLEAMLQNLQLQMGLLNHQLDIIKQINHSKKTAYEKAYKDA
jgi:hypothetical protein